MKSKKVIRYYSDCGRGFWKKQQALIHDINCKCWKNPKFKSCISCVNKCLKKDSNGMEQEPKYLQVWEYNDCKHSDSGVPVHEDFKHIRKFCSFYKHK